MKSKGVKIGVIGCGTIGTGVVKCLLENKKYLHRHLGFPLELVRVADLYPQKKRSVKIPAGVMTRNSDAVLNDPEIDIIVELVGGTTFNSDSLNEVNSHLRLVERYWADQIRYIY